MPMKHALTLTYTDFKWVYASICMDPFDMLHWNTIINSDSRFVIELQLLLRSSIVRILSIRSILADNTRAFVVAFYRAIVCDYFLTFVVVQTLSWNVSSSCDLCVCASSSPNHRATVLIISAVQRGALASSLNIRTLRYMHVWVCAILCVRVSANEPIIERSRMTVAAAGASGCRWVWARRACGNELVTECSAFDRRTRNAPCTSIVCVCVHH